MRLWEGLFDGFRSGGEMAGEETETGGSRKGASNDPPYDARRFSPSAARNREPIRQAVSPYLPNGARVLEIGSGTGEHALHFCAARPDLEWTPSDPDAGSRASVEAWRALSGLAGLRPVLALDASAADWPGLSPPYDAVIAINVVHIAPWSTCEGLFAGASRTLTPDGRLILYGPFARDGAHTAPSNADFDASLRSRNPDWGVRDLADLSRLGQARGLEGDAEISMPANNLTLVFRRASAGA